MMTSYRKGNNTEHPVTPTTPQASENPSNANPVPFDPQTLAKNADLELGTIRVDLGTLFPSTPLFEAKGRAPTQDHTRVMIPGPINPRAVVRRPAWSSGLQCTLQNTRRVGLTRPPFRVRLWGLLCTVARRGMVRWDAHPRGKGTYARTGSARGSSFVVFV